MATTQDARNSFAPPLPCDMFSRALRRYASRPCLTVGERTLTYAEVDSASNRLAQALKARGIGHRDAVALYLRNGFEVVIADMAITKLGAVRTPLNEMLSASDIAYMLAFSEAKALIAHSSFSENLPQPMTPSQLSMCAFALRTLAIWTSSRTFILHSTLHLTTRQRPQRKGAHRSL